MLPWLATGSSGPLGEPLSELLRLPPPPESARLALGDAAVFPVTSTPAAELPVG